MLKHFFVGIIMVWGAIAALQEDREKGGPHPVVSGEHKPALRDPDALPANGALNPQVKKSAQKAACCFCAMLPCLCVVGCFNALTERMNQITCGCFYQAFPCLNCT